MKKRFTSLALILALLCVCVVPAMAEEDDPLGLYDYVMQENGNWVSQYKYDEPISITSVLGLGETAWYEEGQTSDYNVWLMQVYAELGIRITYDWVVASDEYNTKLNLALTGDLPDVFRVNSTQLTNLVEADLVYDLTDVYEQYGSDFLKETMAQDPFALESASYDGRLYAIPQPGAPYMDGGNSMYVRTDWLTNLGKDVPATAEELTEVMYAFAKDDPDQNGAADTYGLYLDNKLNALGLFSAIYGGYPTIWTMADDDTVQWGGVADGMKDVLGKLAQLYADGVIDPEFAVKDGSVGGEDIAAGKHGMIFGSWVEGYGTMQYSIANSDTADWKAYPAVSNNGEATKMPAPFATGTYYVVSKDCAHPEAVVALANYYLERGYQECKDLIEPLTDPALHGMMHAYCFFNMEPAYKNLDIQQRLLYWQETGDDSKLWPDDKENYAVQETYVTDRSTTGFAVTATFGPYDSGLGVVQYYMDNDLFVNDVFTAADTAGMVEYWGTLEALQEEYYTKIITGGDIDTLWSEFVDQWNAAGGDIVTEEVNDWYRAK